ncbi:hypothetical protein GCM10010267_10200 [Streptomyces griseorubens]|nr:hypothetical protein GCM10010267_10200 [Streptomyces griseorubens]
MCISGVPSVAVILSVTTTVVRDGRGAQAGFAGQVGAGPVSRATDVRWRSGLVGVARADRRDLLDEVRRAAKEPTAR